MRNTIKFVVVLVVINSIVGVTSAAPPEGDDGDKKYRLDKLQKLARSSQKKPIFTKPGSQKTEKAKVSTIKKEDQSALEPASEPVLEPVEEPVVESAAAEHDNSETERICLSIAEDSVPDFLTKFGLITHLIDDVNAFRAEVKTSRSRQLERAAKAQQSDEDLWWPHQNKKKKYSKNKFAKNSDRQYTRTKSQGSGFAYDPTGIKSDPFKHNYLYSRLRQSKNQETVPTCFGYEYLTAIEAFDQETGLPDLESFRGSMSEMLNMKLTSQISDIVDICADGNQDSEFKVTSVCPIVEVKHPDIKLLDSGDKFDHASEMRSACEESCFTDNDCGSSGERCCPNDCGGHTCQSPQKWISPKQKAVQGQCVKADAFMQCLYDQLKEKVCNGRVKS